MFIDSNSNSRPAGVRVTAPAAPRFAWVMAALVGVWAFAYLPWLGLLDLHSEEPRRALVARTMLETGQYWVPQLAGEPYLHKPPLFNWAIAASASLFGGLSELSARLPSVLSVLALALLFVWGVRSRLKPWPLAFFGVSLLLAPAILGKGRMAEIDPLFTLLVAASIGSWYRLHSMSATGIKLWVLPLALVALAYLTKREPAVVFFYLAVGPFLVLRGRWRLLLEPGHFAGIAVAAALAISWPLQVAAQTGWRAFWDILRFEVLQQGMIGLKASDVLAHVASYPFAIFALLLPFSALLPLLACRELRARVRARFGDLYIFAALAVAANLPIYWFHGHISVRYVQPLYPFMLLLAAMVLEVLGDDRASATRTGLRYLRVVYWTSFGIAALGVGVLLASPALPRVVAGFVPLFPTAVTIALVSAGGVALWILAHQARDPAPPILLAVFCTAVLALRATYFNVVLPERATRYNVESSAPLIASEVERLVERGAPIHAGNVPWAVWYYGERLALRRLTDDMQPSAGSWLLIRENLTARFPLEEQARFVYRDDVLLLGRAK